MKKYKLIKFEYLGITRYTVASRIESDELYQLSIYSFLPKDKLDKVIKAVIKDTYLFFTFNHKKIKSFEILCEFNEIEELSYEYPEHFI